MQRSFYITELKINRNYNVNKACLFESFTQIILKFETFKKYINNKNCYSLEQEAPWQRVQGP